MQFRCSSSATLHSKLHSAGPSVYSGSLLKPPRETLEPLVTRVGRSQSSLYSSCPQRGQLVGNGMVDTMVGRCSMWSMVGNDVSMNIRDSLSQCRSLDAKVTMQQAIIS